MKLNQLIILVIITFLIAAQGRLFAQSPKADFDRIVQKYSNLENLSLKMEAYAYRDQDTNDRELSFSGTFKKRGEDFYTNAWDREMIVRGQHMVVVDHDEQKIAIGRARSQQTAQLAMPQFSIDSLEAHGGKVTYSGKEGDLRKYEISLPDALVFSTDLYISDDDIIKRIVYHYQELEDAKPAYAKLDVYYKNVSFATPAASYFDDHKFYDKNNDGELIPAPRYRDYAVKQVDYSSYSQYQN